MSMEMSSNASYLIVQDLRQSTTFEKDNFLSPMYDCFALIVRFKKGLLISGIVW